MNTTFRSVTALLAATMIPLGAVGCASMNKTQKGAVIGVATGGAAGAVIGKAAGSTAKGAILGAAVGGAAGAIIGSRMDKQGRELMSDLENAKVERVGEGLLVTFDTGLLFDFDSDRVKGAAADNLTSLAKSLKKYSESEVLIVGHTDATGTDSYNMNLSDRRARSAADYLTTSGVQYSRIRTNGRGEIEPVASNDNEMGRQQNRRVEVAIFASEAYRNQITRSGSR
jgi:outer membrane protein OmpA-like peptidoglycan-associated protein